MKWYGILALLVLIVGLAGIVYLGMNGDKIGVNFGEPSFISSDISNQPSTSAPSSQSTQKMCNQWQQELTNVGVQKSLTDPRYIDYPEFQSLLQKEYNLDQKILSRCR